MADPQSNNQPPAPGHHIYHASLDVPGESGKPGKIYYEFDLGPDGENGTYKFAYDAHGLGPNQTYYGSGTINDGEPITDDFSNVDYTAPNGFNSGRPILMHGEFGQISTVRNAVTSSMATAFGQKVSGPSPQTVLPPGAIDNNRRDVSPSELGVPPAGQANPGAASPASAGPGAQPTVPPGTYQGMKLYDMPFVYKMHADGTTFDFDWASGKSSYHATGTFKNGVAHFDAINHTDGRTGRSEIEPRDSGENDIYKLAEQDATKALGQAANPAAIAQANPNANATPAAPTKSSGKYYGPLYSVQQALSGQIPGQSQNSGLLPLDAPGIHTPETDGAVGTIPLKTSPYADKSNGQVSNFDIYQGPNNSMLIYETTQVQGYTIKGATRIDPSGQPHVESVTVNGVTFNDPNDPNIPRDTPNLFQHVQNNAMTAFKGAFHLDPANPQSQAAIAKQLAERNIVLPGTTVQPLKDGSLVSFNDRNGWDVKVTFKSNPGGTQSFSETATDSQNNKVTRTGSIDGHEITVDPWQGNKAGVSCPKDDDSVRLDVKRAQVAAASPPPAAAPPRPSPSSLAAPH
jgi:hypothetical protein